MTLTTIKTYLRSTVAQNAASLYVIQFANYLLPLITVPYVVRVLTPHGYGLVAFGTSLVGYFVTMVDYGFSYSATRSISVQRRDVEAVSRTVFNVYGAKLLLCFGGFLVLLSLVTLIPALKQNRRLLFIIYGLVLGNVLFPTWLFQGMERMVPISVINLVIRLFVVLGIFTLIKAPEDYLWYAGLNSLGSIGAGAVGAAVSFWMFPLRLLMPSWRGIWAALKEGWMLFLSQASVSLYTVGNAFILGLLTTPAIVGYYSAAEKIMFSISGLLGPISQSIFPKFSKLVSESKDSALFLGGKILKYMGSLGILLSIVTFIFAPLITKVLFGKGYENSVAPIRILAPFIFINAVSNVMGIQLMLPFNHDRAFTLILFFAGVINISLVFIFVPLWNQNGMALSMLISGLFIIITQIAFLYAHQIFPFRLIIRRS